MNWWGVYIAVWLVAAGATAILTAGLLLAGKRYNIVDRVGGEAHKQHTADVPHLGGSAIFAGCVGTLIGGMVLASLIQPILNNDVAVYISEVSAVLSEFAMLICGAAAVLALGIVDDLYSIRAVYKLGGQLLIAGIVSAFAVQITLFIDNSLFSWLLTTAWFVAVINAVNFFDNMDGQAAGTAFVGSLVFLITAVYRQQYFVGALAAAVCGASLGFLLFNWPPAKIFMGDAGSHFLGYMLAVLGVKTTFFQAGESITPVPVLIPLLALALPLFDLAAVVIIRLLKGQPVYVGDRSHISHRFSRMGLTDKQTAVVIHLLSFAIGSGALTLLWLPFTGAALILLQTAAILAVVSILHILNPLKNGG